MSVHLHTPVKSRPRKTKAPTTRLNGKSLMVQCDRPDLGTRYAYVSVTPCSLKIIFLNIQGEMIDPRATEYLAFSEYPEAALVHDGQAWNVAELACWLEMVETPEGHA